VNAANAVIQKNEARRPKQLWTRRNGGAIIRCQAATDEMDEAELVVADLLEHQRAHKRSYSDYAILMRMNTQARPFEEALRRYNVPYVVVGGMQFYDRKEIRDCLSYLRLLVNTNDEEALLRVVNVPPRGAGEATVRKLAEYADNAGISLYRALGDLDHIADIQPSTKRALQGLFELFEQWRARLAHDRPSLVARGLWTELDYRRELEGGNLTAEQVDERLANVNVLLDSIDYYERSVGQPSLDEFLQQITLLNRDDEEELAKGRVAVMTIHAGKGLEFPYVYIVGALQGVLPHAKSVTGPQGMAEERRLFYVAVTRARDELMISYPAARLRHGTLEQCKPSEFLDDIPAELLAWDRNAFAGKASGEQVASMVDRFRKQIAEAE
jgi:superfamily I DNA/RNA helicase